MARKIPRPFKYPWGSGQIVENASATREHSEPTLQLLEFQEDGQKRYDMIRFCSYAPGGAFRRVIPCLPLPMTSPSCARR